MYYNTPPHTWWKSGGPIRQCIQVMNLSFNFNLLNFLCTSKEQPKMLGVGGKHTDTHTGERGGVGTVSWN